ncbi:MAG: glycosyltransferase family 2 protein [Candidatus Solibacter usitatus]|nr:glycosyltransferase family 2 protein [Candidatus Solibacter usitatus]
MQVPPPHFSIIVVNLDRKDLLQAALQSLMRQVNVAAHEAEVVVIDNGSQDGSAEMVEREFSAGPFPVTLIRNSTNKGFCEANNQGIAVARGEFVVLLNNDAEADCGWLRELSQAFHFADGVGMAASKILVWEDPRRIDKAGHLIFLDGQNRGRGSGELDQGQYDTMEEVLWPDGCAAMYRREMLREIGGFDEDFFAYADDAELGLRARIAGWNCVYAPKAVVRHHRGSTMGVRSLRRVELIERNRVLLVAKHFPWSLLCLNAALYGARIAAGIWAAIRNKGEISRYRGWSTKLRLALSLLRADLEAARMLPRMWRKRREMNSMRRVSSRQLWKLLWKHRISLRELSQQAI